MMFQYSLNKSGFAQLNEQLSEIGEKIILSEFEKSILPSQSV